jgi:outer membrane receptor for ferrienterochelin and colicin
VIDISMKEGNMKEFHGEGGVGLIASRLTLEGPIKKDKASFIVSGRRTYIDILARPIIKAQARAAGEEVDLGYYFYDLNGKLNYKFSDRDRLYVSAYLGDDRFYARNEDDYWYEDKHYKNRNRAGLNWGNLTTALRWNHMYNQKLFSNTTLTYSRYRFNIFESFREEVSEGGNVTEENEFHAEYLSGIRDFGLKADFDYLPDPDHFIRAGANLIHHTFEPGAFAFNHFIEGDTIVGSDPIYAMEHAFYIEDDYKVVNKQLKINGGLHYSGFAVNESYYHSLQPRIAARYLLLPDLFVKASYAAMAQYIHLLTNSGIGLPTDLWVPVTEDIKPQRSSQIALGLAKTIANEYEVSLEGYYKNMDNLIEYKEGATFLNLDKNWETKVATGKGWSYGVEAFLQKKTGKTTGWLGYTLSWTNRQFRGLNGGEVFPYKYDRRHDISVSVVHKFNEKTELGSTWVYGTGNAITLPVTTYQKLPAISNPNDGFHYYYGDVNNYSKRNEYRMPAYHRLDISLGRFKKTRWGERRWVFGVYNAYNRQNPFYIDVSYDEEGHKKFTQLSLFQFIPSVSYNFSF